VSSITIEPVKQPIVASVTPPGSKSITNRARICAALADGQSTLSGVLDSEDTRVMIESLRRLGIEVHQDDQRDVMTISGCGGHLPRRSADLFVGNSGTTIRFLTAALAACEGGFRLDGVERMRERPIGDLLDALNQLGGDVVSERKNNCPPVHLRARGLAGGTARVRGNISSQFLSGLLMACPYAHQDVVLEVDGELVSQPYVSMTIGVMRSFGVEVPSSDLHRMHIAAPRRYRGVRYAIEPDASAASYFWAAAAITGGRVTVRGLSRTSLQGDVEFCECLVNMGCTVTYDHDSISVQGRPLHGVTVNMNAISDTVQTLAAVAVFAQGPTTITGVGHIRHKETDRIGDLARELRRLGADVEELIDGLRITPKRKGLHSAEIETYNDHRMAMSLSLVGLKVPGITIKNPGCVAKTYPRFFDDLKRIVTANA
jgi:3-phosphoshikimate 1-carboxyvinyltransferase